MPHLPVQLPIEPLPRPFDITLHDLPGSKSLSNRAFLLAALADGPCTIEQALLDADDTRFMLQALQKLGFEIAVEPSAQRVVIHGRAGRIPASEAQLYLGNAGTAYRFLTAACCLGQGTYELDGLPRMRQRPIGQLVDCLHQLGADIEYLDQSGYPPLRIHAHGLNGGQLEIASTLSSQYISALLQVAPFCPGGLSLRLTGPLTSAPYVRMTLQLMEHFGARVQTDPDLSHIHVAPGAYRPTCYRVEPDASNASYFLAAAAVVPGSRCTVSGLGSASLQGDVGFAQILARMGAQVNLQSDAISVSSPPSSTPLQGIDVDLNAMPDMAQTLAVLAMFARGPTCIRNIGNLRLKETDRLAALASELTKFGASVRIDNHDLLIMPPRTPGPPAAPIDTYDDHRMAMSFAIAGLVLPGVRINHPACVSKTFPRFFEYLERLRHAGT